MAISDDYYRMLGMQHQISSGNNSFSGLGGLLVMPITNPIPAKSAEPAPEEFNLVLLTGDDDEA